MITDRELAEWRQMAAEVQACIKSGESKPIIILFAAAMATAVPTLIAEVGRLREEFCHKEEEAACAKSDAARLQNRLDAIKEAP